MSRTATILRRGSRPAVLRPERKRPGRGGGPAEWVIWANLERFEGADEGVFCLYTAIRPGAPFRRIPIDPREAALWLRESLNELELYLETKEDSDE